jgi:two-component system chemotaxis response regulator CheY
MQALVVDDSFLMRTILTRMLEEFGFEVRTAKDGLQAVERLGEGPAPDLMLLDWYMPDMNGLDVLSHIRGAMGLKDMRVVMVTGENDPAMRSWAMDAGADDYLVRPFNADSVAGTLLNLGVLQAA